MRKLFVCALALATFVACDKDPQTEGLRTDGDVYMSFSVKMETTRSATDNEDGYGSSDANPDTEVGQNYENTISKVDIVLENAEGNCVVATVDTPAAASTDTYVAKFSSKDLTAGNWKVYIYANCDAPVVDGKLDKDAVSSESVANMTKNNQFWMTNAYEAVAVTIPEDLSAYATSANPLSLGSHFVERSMARFDIMPVNNNVYELTEQGVTVTLTEAAIINHSEKFYMLRRVSADGTNANWIIGGNETKNNYVVDVDYAKKAERWGGTYLSYLQSQYAKDGVADFSSYMHSINDEVWQWKSIAVADLQTPDSWDGSVDGNHDPAVDKGNHDLNDYYIWQYAKENTIPKMHHRGEDYQLKGYTTGIVYRGLISSTNETIAAAMADKERIYVFENKLIGDWEDVEAEAANNPSLQVAVNTINAIVDDPATEDKVEAPTNTDYAKAGFTGYSADEEGNYYAYYYYWNRHNDNGNNVVMGPMEFAVVRNNVYKLCVDKISKLGHPTPDKDPDPDPENPWDPDESDDDDYYFTVTVKVLPWVVRVNHIEF